MKRNKKKGFTLVELIAVIAILAILAAVVVPKISSYAESARLSTKKADTSSILSAIQVYNIQAASTAQIDLSSSSIVTVGNLATGGMTLDANAGNATTDLHNIVDRVIAKNGAGTDTGLGNGKSLGSATLVKNLDAILNATN